MQGCKKEKRITVICRHAEGALVAIERESGVEIAHAYHFDPETLSWGQGRYFGYVTGPNAADGAAPLLRGIAYMRDMGYIG